MDAKSLRGVLPVLKMLQSVSSEDRINMLPHLAKPVHEGIVECIYNTTCNKHIPMEWKKVIKRHTMKDAETYKYLLKPNINLRKRQMKLQQIGGSGLGLILQAAVPVLEEVLHKGKESNRTKKLRKKEEEEEESEEETSTEEEEEETSEDETSEDETSEDKSSDEEE